MNKYKRSSLVKIKVILILLFTFFSNGICLYSQTPLVCPEGNGALFILNVLIYEDGVFKKSINSISGEPLSYCTQKNSGNIKVFIWVLPNLLIFPNSFISPNKHGVKKEVNGSTSNLPDSEGRTNWVTSNHFYADFDFQSTANYLVYGNVLATSEVSVRICTNCGSGPETDPPNNYKPIAISTPNGCNLVTTIITNPLSTGFKYYWSKSLPVIKDPQKIFDISSGTGYNFTAPNTSGTYFVQAYLELPLFSTWYGDPSQFDVNFPVKPEPPIFLGPKSFCECKNDPITFSAQSAPGTTIHWSTKETNLNLGTGNTKTFYPELVLTGADYYFIKAVDQNNCASNAALVNITPAPCNCENGKFSPIQGTEYVLQAWVSNGNLNASNLEYSKAQIKIHFYDASNNLLTTSESYTANLLIVETWRKMEHKVIVPSGTVSMGMELLNTNTSAQSVYFDDIRLFRAKGEMVSYVYNQATMQLEYELNKDNMYTHYIRNLAGEVIKVNQETMDGIRTITESRSHIQRDK